MISTESRRDSEKSPEALTGELMEIRRKKREAERDFQARVMLPLEMEEARIENQLYKMERIVHLSPEPGTQDLVKLGIQVKSDETMDVEQVEERLQQAGYVCLESLNTSSVWLKK